MALATAPVGQEISSTARLCTVKTALTDELIARYAADLSLVDALLAPPYPAKVPRGAEVRR